LQLARTKSSLPKVTHSESAPSIIANDLDSVEEVPASWACDELVQAMLLTVEQAMAIANDRAALWRLEKRNMVWVIFLRRRFCSVLLRR
jgi:hypothetical protein